MKDFGEGIDTLEIKVAKSWKCAARKVDRGENLHRGFFGFKEGLAILSNWLTAETIRLIASLWMLQLRNLFSTIQMYSN